jgi:TusA-related sulfurtransferase
MSTDRGSVADFQSWAKIAKSVEIITQETESVEDASLYVHYVKRTT